MHHFSSQWHYMILHVTLSALTSLFYTPLIRYNMRFSFLSLKKFHMINVFKGKSKSKHSFLALCLPCFSSHRLVKETGLAMNRWTEQTAMLSSLISEKTVKKGAPFSHTLTRFHLFVHFIRVRPSFSQEEQTKPLMTFPFTFRSPPPLLLSSFSCFPPLFSSYHLFPAITLTCTYPPPPLFPFLPPSGISIHRFEQLFYAVISCLTKLFNNTTSMISLSSVFFHLQKSNFYRVSTY